MGLYFIIVDAIFLRPSFIIVFTFIKWYEVTSDWWFFWIYHGCCC